VTASVPVPQGNQIGIDTRLLAIALPNGSVSPGSFSLQWQCLGH